MSSSTISIAVRRLVNPSDAELHRIIAVLMAAFEGDPFNDFLVGGDTSLSYPSWEFNVRVAAIGGHIDIASIGPDTNDIVGVAVWWGPGQIMMSTEEQREVASRVFFSKCPEELRKWWDEHFTPTMSRLADESLGKGFKDAQWALNLFGVVPEHHRKGIAKAMMNAAEERAKSDVVSIVLETTTDIDVLIYKRLGFELKGETTIVSPQGQSPMWQMLKSL